MYGAVRHLLRALAISRAHQAVLFVHEAREVGEHIVQHLELLGGHIVEPRGAINFIHQRVEIGHQRRIHAAFRQCILIAVHLVAQVGDPRLPRLVPDGWRFCGVVDAPQGLKHRFAHSLRDMARIRGLGQPGNQVVRLARDGAPQARFGLGFGPAFRSFGCCLPRSPYPLVRPRALLGAHFLHLCPASLPRFPHRLRRLRPCFPAAHTLATSFSLCPRGLEIRLRLRQAQHAV